MRFKNKKLLVAAVMAGTTIIGSGLFAGLEMLKRDPSFCTVCHLPDGAIFHEEKKRVFMERPPRNLAALHCTKRVGFACTGCHEGSTFGQRVAVRWEEAKNTATYFLGSVREPQRLKVGLMPDETCESCHPSFPVERGVFHGIAAHRPKLKLPCINCHVSHAAGDPTYHFLDRERVRKNCANCHRNIPGTFKATLRPPGAAAKADLAAPAMTIVNFLSRDHYWSMQNEKSGLCGPGNRAAFHRPEQSW